MNVPPLSPPTEEASAAAEVPSAESAVAVRSSWWQRIGGGSLTVSLLIHALVILIAILIVRTVITNPPETIDFLPGGGGGGKSSEARMAEKRRAATVTAPRMRTVSAASNAAVSLPDIQTSLSDFTALSQAAPVGGGMGGGSGGLRGSGSGGLMGNGQGSGFGPGKGSGFVSIPLIFGQKIDARRMAVVLDMSSSMYTFLPIVIKEVDKVAPGSMVVLHYGCGLTDNAVSNPGLESTSAKGFEKDRIITSLLESQTAAMNQREREALFSLVKKRPKTFYVPSSGVGSTWIALTDEKLKDVDAIYWFADFADGLAKDRVEEVSRKLRGRKQKLYIHPSNPKWLEPGDPLAANVAMVDGQIVQATGGKVLKVDLKKEAAAKDDKP